jgi:isocitrate/isopropylmalate dehydrogenase
MLFLTENMFGDILSDESQYDLRFYRHAASASMGEGDFGTL